MNRRRFLLGCSALAVLLPAGITRAAATRAATLYKDPQCGCCTEYGHYLEANGYAVTVVADVAAMDKIKTQHRVPEALAGCHSTVIEGYVVEGHVPVSAIERMLAEKSSIRGLSLPGMPPGSPGMSGEKEAPFEIYAITDDPSPPLFAVE